MSLTARGSRGKSIRVFLLIFRVDIQVKDKQTPPGGWCDQYNTWVRILFLWEHLYTDTHVATAAGRLEKKKKKYCTAEHFAYEWKQLQRILWTDGSRRVTAGGSLFNRN